MTHSEAYEQGYRAYSINMSVLDNYYDQGTQEYQDWKSGWYAAALFG